MKAFLFWLNSHKSPAKTASVGNSVTGYEFFVAYAQTSPREKIVRSWFFKKQ